jgi:hypothetical protein
MTSSHRAVAANSVDRRACAAITGARLSAGPAACDAVEAYQPPGATEPAAAACFHTVGDCEKRCTATTPVRLPTTRVCAATVPCYGEVDCAAQGADCAVIELSFLLLVDEPAIIERLNAQVPPR